jgi:hypothetical protein
MAYSKSFQVLVPAHATQNDIRLLVQAIEVKSQTSFGEHTQVRTWLFIQQLKFIHLEMHIASKSILKLSYILLIKITFICNFQIFLWYKKVFIFSIESCQKKNRDDHFSAKKIAQFSRNVIIFFALLEISEAELSKLNRWLQFKSTLGRLH